ncbi:MAG: glycosyltransferase family 4 protein [Bacteroidota bacterium]
MAFFEQNEKAALMEFDAFLTTSTFTKHYLQKRQLQAPILVVPPALTHTFPPIQRSPQPIKAIIIANLVERKGILPFFKALVSMGIEKYTDHLTIDIYGTDQIEKSYAQSCLSYIEQHPALQKVVIYQGTRSQSQLITIYQQANLFLSTSFMESFGMALQEAVAAQLPILTLAAGNAQHHIQPGSNGFVCSDLMHLTQKLFHLASTPSALAQLLQQAQQYQPYRNYRWANAAQQFKDQFLDNCKDYCYI